ncbi:AsmA family protein [Rhodopseudomonas sp. B29]|uniref:AsmA family protein n=1 Tax=Rhodopseudomonas sp. B29 TaxID=95607 RepID=UPI0003467730|nr:AsmA family protein [Rhodopseudomonas sp. B29]
MKIGKIAAALLALLIVAALALMVVGLPAGALTAAIQSRVESETGYRIDIGGAGRLSLFPRPGLTLTEVKLRDPADTQAPQIDIAELRAELPLGSVLSGKPEVSQLTVTRPVVRVPLLRRRAAAPAVPISPRGKEARSGAQPTITRIVVEDGTVILANAADAVENRITPINATIDIDAARHMSAHGGARLDNKALQFDITAALPEDASQPTPVEFKFDAPDLLPAKLAAKAELRRRGPLLQINNLSGSLGDGTFNGWASADLGGKPQVKLDLDFSRLELPASRRPAPPPGAPWSDARFDLTGLNYVDAELRLSAAEFDAGAVHLAPVALDAKLSNGVLGAQTSQLGAYGGTATGRIVIDASGRVPALTLSGDLDGIRALPLLRAATDFDRLDGKLQAKLALQASGDSLRGLMTTLSGTTFVTVRDGQIRGVNVAGMIRSLISSPLDGWQQSRDEVTDLTQLAASFRLDQGKAQTSDLTLAGPLVRMTGAGTIDVAAKTLALKVEPKLVLTTQGQTPQAGQSETAQPIGFGIPVVIEGPWASPRIFPDTAGILDDPAAAYARLRQVGKGLFGVLGGKSGADSPGGDALGGALGDSLGRLIQQGLSGGGLGVTRGAPPQGAPPAPDPAPRDNDATMNSIMKQLFSR